MNDWHLHGSAKRKVEAADDNKKINTPPQAK